MTDDYSFLTDEIKAIRAELSTIKNMISDLTDKVNNLSESVVGAGIVQASGTVIDELDEESLPESYRKTLGAIRDLQQATASTVADHNGRSRNVETIYLNALHKKGWLEKERRGKQV